MKVELKDNKCIVTRETGDRPCAVSPAGESLLLHRVKMALIGQGHDVIKKRMWKDGHLFGNDTTQYIRTRSKKSGMMIYDPLYAIRNMAEDFNVERRVELAVERY